MVPDTITQTIVATHETVLWSAFADESRLTEEVVDERNSSVLWLVIMAGLAVSMMYLLYMYLWVNVPAYTELPKWVEMLSTFVIFLLSLYFMSFFGHIITDPEEPKPHIYIITDQRLIAANDDHQIVDQIARSDIEMCIYEPDTNDELIVTHIDHPDGDHKFHFYFVPNALEAKAIIEEKLDKAHWPESVAE